MSDHPNTFHLIIASVGESKFDGAALSATIPTSAGEITILPHHEPLVTTLKEGTIIVRTSAEEPKELHVESGVLEMSGNRAVVLL
jgi:F-type H+-transporting ATPase subunit epsilon